MCSVRSLIARFGRARVSLPGGCAWGPRPVNLHMEAMKKLGAEIDLREGYIHARAGRLTGTRIHFDVSSVGATGNTMMAAVLAQGTTLIDNAAIEPEITQLAEFLVAMGAHINGVGTSRMEIEGVDALHRDGRRYDPGPRSKPARSSLRPRCAAVRSP